MARNIGRTLKIHGIKGMANKARLANAVKKMPEHVDATPADIQLEITTACNLRCTMCEHSYWREKQRHMSYGDFVKIIEKFQVLDSINLTGIGENLMNKDFIKMLEYLKRRSIKVIFNDNMTMIDKGIGEKLVKLGIDEVHVSFDGATKKTYERIRRGANFENVVGAKC